MMELRSGMDKHGTLMLIDMDSETGESKLCYPIRMVTEKDIESLIESLVALAVGHPFKEADGIRH